MRRLEEGAQPLSSRILLVEDDEPLAMLEALNLEDEGFLVQTVGLGRAALDALRSGEFSLMVLDYKLPDMTGEDVMARLAASGRRVPVVVVTGYPDPAVEERMRAAGVVDYLVKDTDLKFLEDLPKVARAVVTGSVGGFEPPVLE